MGSTSDLPDRGTGGHTVILTAACGWIRTGFVKIIVSGDPRRRGPRIREAVKWNTVTRVYRGLRAFWTAIIAKIKFSVVASSVCGQHPNQKDLLFSSIKSPRPVRPELTSRRTRRRNFQFPPPLPTAIGGVRPEGSLLVNCIIIFDFFFTTIVPGCGFFLC